VLSDKGRIGHFAGASRRCATTLSAPAPAGAGAYFNGEAALDVSLHRFTSPFL
jgi:hypothetical protein